MSKRGQRRAAHKKDAHGTAHSVWAWPCALAVLTALGLICALLGDGGWDAVSAVALGIPVVVGAWFGLRRGAG